MKQRFLAVFMAMFLAVSVVAPVPARASTILATLSGEAVSLILGAGGAAGVGYLVKEAVGDVVDISDDDVRWISNKAAMTFVPGSSAAVTVDNYYNGLGDADKAAISSWVNARLGKESVNYVQGENASVDAMLTACMPEILTVNDSMVSYVGAVDANGVELMPVESLRKYIAAYGTALGNPSKVVDFNNIFVTQFNELFPNGAYYLSVHEDFTYSYRWVGTTVKTMYKQYWLFADQPNVYSHSQSPSTLTWTRTDGGQVFDVGLSGVVAGNTPFFDVGLSNTGGETAHVSNPHAKGPAQDDPTWSNQKAVVSAPVFVSSTAVSPNVLGKDQDLLNADVNEKLVGAGTAGLLLGQDVWFPPGYWEELLGKTGSVTNSGVDVGLGNGTVNPPITGDLTDVVTGIGTISGQLTGIQSAINSIVGTGSLNWSGFQNIGLSAVFPFCIPFDLINTVKSLQAEGEAPRFEIPMSAFPGASENIVIDLEDFEPWAKIVRFFVLLGVVIGLILITRGIIKG